MVVVVQLCEDDWCAWWPPGGSASSQSWGERGGCWGDLVQVIRIINILPNPCLRGSSCEGSLEDGSQCADFQMLVAMHRQWHLWQRDREGHTGRCCQSAEVDPAQCAILITYYRHIYHARYIEGTTRGSLTKIGSFWRLKLEGEFHMLTCVVLEGK